MAKKINRRGRGGSQRVIIFLCVSLRSLRFFESSQKIIKSLKKFGVSITYQSGTIFAVFAPFAVNKEKAHRKDPEGPKVKGSMKITNKMKLQNNNPKR